jgi:hypothetical protein
MDKPSRVTERRQKQSQEHTFQNVLKQPSFGAGKNEGACSQMGKAEIP